MPSGNPVLDPILSSPNLQLQPWRSSTYLHTYYGVFSQVEEFFCLKNALFAICCAVNSGANPTTFEFTATTPALW
jgi:hypothetical protein